MDQIKGIDLSDYRNSYSIRTNSTQDKIVVPKKRILCLHFLYNCLFCLFINMIHTSDYQWLNTTELTTARKAKNYSQAHASTYCGLHPKRRCEGGKKCFPPLGLFPLNPKTYPQKMPAYYLAGHLFLCWLARG